MNITRRQSQVLAFIGSHTKEHGFAPSYREIASALGLQSKGNVARIVAALKQRGAVEALPHKARSIDISRSPKGRRSLATDLAQALERLAVAEERIARLEQANGAGLP